jgi:hypothetical protein
VRWVHGVISNGTRFVQPILRTPFALLLDRPNALRHEQVGWRRRWDRPLSPSRLVASADKSRSARTPSPSFGGDEQVGSHRVPTFECWAVRPLVPGVARSLPNQESEGWLACRPEAHAMCANNR